MRNKIKIIITLMLLSLSSQLSTAQYTLKQMIVLNEGPWGGPVTVGTYNPATKMYANFDTIAARFATDVIIDNGFIYVAADTLLIKYDLNTYQRLAIQTVQGIRELAIWKNQILVTRAEINPLPSYFQVYDKNNLNFLYELPVSERSAEVKVVGDTAYVAVNGWGSVGKLAVIDLNNQMLNREIDLGADGLNPENVIVENNKVYTVNSLDWTNSSVTKYDVTTTASQSTRLNTATNCGASDLYLGNMYFQVFGEDKLGVYNVSNSQVWDTLYINKNIYGMGIDSVNARIYLGATDYVSYGKVFIYDFFGALKDSFDVNVSPGTFAFDVRTSSGINESEIGSWKLEVYPNPFSKKVIIRITNQEQITNNEIKIYDLLGREIKTDIIRLPDGQAGNSDTFVIRSENLPDGIYILKIQSGENLVVRKIVKQ